MKKVLFITVAFFAGYATNTETGKKLTSWIGKKLKGLKEGVMDKVNTVTSEE